MQQRNFSIIKCLFFVFLCSTCIGWTWFDKAAENTEKGNKAYSEEQFDAALESYKTAQELRPEDPVILFNRGDALYKLGDYEAAESAFRQALTAEDGAFAAKAHYNLGNALFKEQKIDEAIKHYVESLKRDPNIESAKRNLEFALLVKKAMEQQQKQQQQQQCDNPEDQQSEDQQKEQERNQTPQPSGSPTPMQAEPGTPGPEESATAEAMREQTATAMAYPQGTGTPEVTGTPEAMPQEVTGTPGEEKSITEEEAIRLLNSLKSDEKEALKQMIRFKTRNARKKKVEKDW